MSLTAFIPGEPVGKGRPRFNTATGHATTPPRTRKWEKTASELLTWLARAQGWKHDGEAVAVHIVAVYARPKTLKFPGRSVCKGGGGRPDLDNVVKAVLDAAEKAGVLSNDSAVVGLSASAWYCGLDDKDPGVEVRVALAPT